ncbi:MAG: hypothetical protein IT198_14245 [Acidimicrobiia bacterium]|nr:hypothetical protein [Acidimicrobiia bacterium]
MYLFSRTGRLAGGRTAEAIAWATGITQHVNAVTDIGTRLYASVLSPEVGRLAWVCFVPDLETLESAFDALGADPTFVAESDRGVDFTLGGPDDLVAQIVHGQPDPSREITYVSTVQAVCAGGNLAKGMGVGVEIARHAEKITGVPGMFLTAGTGSYGSVMWLTGFESIGELEAGQQALAADMGWLELLDREAGSAYLEDATVTVQRIWRRIA